MKIFNVKDVAKVYAYSEPVSMARSFPGLTKLVVEKLKKKPENGDLFLFANKKANYLKILFYYREGYCIFAKQLPKGTFNTEAQMGGTLTISELQGLVDNALFVGRKNLSTVKKAA